MEIKMRRFIKYELSGWTKGEISWIVFSCLIIIGLSVYWGDTLMGMISSVTGVLYTLFAGKGKLSAYIFGAVNSVLYAIIAYHSTYYGETMLNALYYFPMQFVGFYVWSKNMNEDTHEVDKRHMKNSLRIATVILIAVLTYVYGLLLRHLGDAMPYVDSFTTVASVIAMVVSIKRYSEQWWIWFAVNALSIYMWWIDFRSGSDNIATLIMWGLYLINGIIMAFKWERDIKKSLAN